MSMEKKDEEQLLEAMKAMKNVDWKKVIKVLKGNHNHSALKHICNHKRDCDD